MVQYKFTDFHVHVTAITKAKERKILNFFFSTLPAYIVISLVKYARLHYLLALK